MPLSKYLTAIATDYKAAEVTCVFLHNKRTHANFNLLTLIELVPNEQPVSPLIGKTGKTHTEPESVDDDYTVFIGRAINMQVEQGLKIFENAESNYILDCGNGEHAEISLLPQAILTPEPTGEFPLLIPNKQEETLGVLLPVRPTGFRVWCKLDKQKSFVNALDEKQRKKIFKKAGKLTAKHLGFDFSALQQHAGHFYLFGCNPYIRFYESSLVDYEKELLIKFRERKGKNLVGGKIVLRDKRGNNYGFHIEAEITTRFQRIPLPNFPDSLETTLFARNGYVLERHTGIWANFEFQTNVHSAVLNLKVQDGDKTHTQKIDKYSNAGISKVGSYDHSTARFLKDSIRNNEIQRLEKSNEFVFFPGSDEDKEKARHIIGRILNKASKTCIMLDPYFGASDLYYAYLISNLSVPIRILSSAAFLRDYVDRKTQVRVRHATNLQTEIDNFKNNIPHQSIECRVLKRDKSPLHDRYIVVDNDAYLFGSSLNEFGTRATTLFKVPAPELLIAKAIDWWQDDSLSVSLDAFVNTLKEDNDGSTGSI